MLNAAKHKLALEFMRKRFWGLDHIVDNIGPALRRPVSAVGHENPTDG